MPRARRGIRFSKNGKQWSREDVGLFAESALDYEKWIRAAEREGKPFNEEAFVDFLAAKFGRTPEALRTKAYWMNRWLHRLENLLDRVIGRRQRRSA